MTILQAVQEAIRQIEGVFLPVRETDNRNRLMTALALLDAVADKMSETPDEKEVT